VAQTLSTTSQLMPENPSGHLHWYWSGLVFSQVPPLRQGCRVPQVFKSKKKEKRKKTENEIIHQKIQKETGETSPAWERVLLLLLNIISTTTSTPDDVTILIIQQRSSKWKAH
jgi:hypothetical protein